MRIQLPPRGTQTTLFGNVERSPTEEKTGRLNIGDATPRTWHHELRRELEKLAEFDIQETDFLFSDETNGSGTSNSRKLFSVQPENGDVYHADDIFSLVQHLLR